MEKKDKILDYYRSGRYECDYDFHLNLEELLREMNLYEWIPALEVQIKTLKKIKQLTEINANCLDEDYDDEEGLCQTYKIRSLINSLNMKDTHKILKQCEGLGWESYETKITKVLVGKTEYETIIERIHCNVHCDQFRIDSMLFVTFFYQIHGENLNKWTEIYQNTIQYYLNYLNNQSNRFKVLNGVSEFTNIASRLKVKNYVGTLNFIVRKCVRFCEIVKLLTGVNNLSLKFTVVKKEIQKLMKKYPEWKFHHQKEDLFSVLPLFKQILQRQKSLNKNKVCRLCFKELKEEEIEHSFCRVLISKKEYFK